MKWNKMSFEVLHKKVNEVCYKLVVSGRKEEDEGGFKVLKTMWHFMSLAHLRFFTFLIWLPPSLCLSQKNDFLGGLIREGLISTHKIIYKVVWSLFYWTIYPACILLDTIVRKIFPFLNVKKE